MIILLHANLFILSFMMAHSSETIPLLILKAAHSGSSWFTSLVNELDGVYLSEEIFYGEHLKRMKGAAEGQAYLLESFKYPMSRWPQGEKRSPNYNKSWAVLGATLNPIQTFPILENLRENVPNLRVVAYIRTNIVKHAVSAVRAEMLFQKCNTNIMYANSNCKLDGGKTYVDVRVFDDRLKLMMAMDEKVLETARILTGGNFFYVQYEYLLNDPKNINQLFVWLGLNPQDVKISGIKGRCQNICVKHTSDDLQTVVANYRELEEWIVKQYPCLVSQLRETRPGAVQPSHKELCGDLFTNVVESRLDFIRDRTLRFAKP